MPYAYNYYCSHPLPYHQFYMQCSENATDELDMTLLLLSYLHEMSGLRNRQPHPLLKLNKPSIVRIGAHEKSKIKQNNESSLLRQKKTDNGSYKFFYLI